MHPIFLYPYGFINVCSLTAMSIFAEWLKSSMLQDFDDILIISKIKVHQTKNFHDVAYK